MKRHLLICGERGVGKSTLIRRLLEHSTLEVGGFVTKRLPVADENKPKDTPFLRAVRGHENAELVFIDEQNRDALLEKLLPHILRWNEA